MACSIPLEIIFDTIIIDKHVKDDYVKDDRDVKNKLRWAIEIISTSVNK
jgi:hypothetical protein